MRSLALVSLLVCTAVASAAPATPERDAQALAAVNAHLDGNWKVRVSPTPLSGDPAARITSKLVRVEAVQPRRLGRKKEDDHFVVFDPAGAAPRWAGKESKGLIVQASRRTPAHELVGMLRDTDKLAPMMNTLLMSGVVGATSTYLDVSLNHSSIPEWAKIGTVAVLGSQRAWRTWSDARKIQDTSRATAIATTIKELRSDDPIDAWATYLNVMRRDHAGTSPFGLGCFYDQLAMRGL